MTLHRPANVDDPATLAACWSRPWVRSPSGARSCSRCIPAPGRRSPGCALPDGVRAIDALGYLDFLCLEAGARIVLTDSGGLQEETTVLGVPCVTLRDETERPVTVTEGTNHIAGATRRASSR